MRSTPSKVAISLLIVVAVPLTIVTTFLVARVDGILPAIFLSAFAGTASLGMAWIMRHALLPPGAGEAAVKKLSITGIVTFWMATLGAFTVDLKASQLILMSIKHFSTDEKIIGAAEEILKISDVPMWLRLLPAVFGTVGIVVLNMTWHRASIVPAIQIAKQENKSSPLSESDYKLALSKYCAALKGELDNIDRSTNWSDRDWTVLEAEVQTIDGRTSKRSLLPNLVKALSSDKKTPLFILLGEPGAGKSVSLRKLVRQLCDSAPRSGILPIYVNLRTIREAPDPAEMTPIWLLNESRRIARQMTGVDGRPLLNGWYEALRSQGRIFFIFDSFDEFPPILESDNSSPQHRAVCRVFQQLIGSLLSPCRVLIASREFKQPVQLGGTRLTIRAFRDWQIAQALRPYFLGTPIRPTEYLRALYTERPELVSLLRNPFTLQLLADYSSSQANPFPESIFQLFSTYVSSRIRNELAYIQQKDLSEGDLMTAASRIAAAMFAQRTASLEIGIEEACHAVGLADQSKNMVVLEALKETRIARVAPGSDGTFAFSHRRFAEYFAAAHLRSEAGIVDLTPIVQNSTWRDCLVLYFEIAPPEEQRRIVTYCVEQLAESAPHLSRVDLRNGIAGIHALRFLHECKPPLKSLEHEAERLGSTIMEISGAAAVGDQQEWASRAFNLKLAAESLPILPAAFQEPILTRVLSTNCAWVIESAVAVYRVGAAIPQAILDVVAAQVEERSTLELIRGRRDLLFAFSLSDAWRPARVLMSVELIRRVTMSCICLLLGAMAFTYGVEVRITFGETIHICALAILIFGALAFVNMGNHPYSFPGENESRDWRSRNDLAIVPAFLIALVMALLDIHRSFEAVYIEHVGFMQSQSLMIVTVGGFLTLTLLVESGRVCRYLVKGRGLFTFFLENSVLVNQAVAYLVFGSSMGGLFLLCERLFGQFGSKIFAGVVFIGFWLVIFGFPTPAKLVRVGHFLLWSLRRFVDLSWSSFCDGARLLHLRFQKWGVRGVMSVNDLCASLRAYRTSWARSLALRRFEESDCHLVGTWNDVAVEMRSDVDLGPRIQRILASELDLE